MSPQASFAASLRRWRRHRGLSQLDLAGRTAISQRHLSFMELGRASPSRDMVMRLAAALDVPLRQHNALLISAGFAPVWRQTDLAAPELREVSSALDYMLAQQEPFPAVAVDRHWNLLQSNSGAVRLIEFLVGPLAPGAPVNLADALVAPDVLRPYLMNWADVVRYFIRSVEADAAADGTPETAALYERLLDYQGVRAAINGAPTEPATMPVLPMHFRKDSLELRLFTTIATLGIPQDITLQELRIECFFPMDDETASILRAWSAESQSTPTGPAPWLLTWEFPDGPPHPCGCGVCRGLHRPNEPSKYRAASCDTSATTVQRQPAAATQPPPRRRGPYGSVTTAKSPCRRRMLVFDPCIRGQNATHRHSPARNSAALPPRGRNAVGVWGSMKSPCRSFEAPLRFGRRGAAP